MTRNKTRLADHMASIHHQATTMRKIIGGWRLAAGSTWKIATEKRIKKEAEKCIGDMSKAYEAQILTVLFLDLLSRHQLTICSKKKLTQQLESALQRVQKAESAKEEQQDELKRALMRGVCALNMEAMSVLRGSSAATSLPLPVSSPQQHSMPRVEPEPSAPVPSDTQAAYEALMVPRTKDKVNFTLPKTSETPSKSSPSQRQSKEYGKRILVTRHQ